MKRLILGSLLLGLLLVGCSNSESFRNAKTLSPEEVKKIKAGRGG